MRHIVAKTDGVPLFMEELTKAILESGLIREDGDRYALAGALTGVAIPATLRDTLNGPPRSSPDGPGSESEDVMKPAGLSA